MNNYSDLSSMFDMMVCDTPVPYYNTGISCGLPNEFGDITPEMLMAPHELVKGRSVFFVNAEGDSMEGVGIYDGDLLLIESTCHFNCKDIVYVIIDGKQLLKSYFIDEKGRHWLVPANEKYEALELTEDMDIRFGGRLYWQCRSPKDTTRNIYQSIMRVLNKRNASTATPVHTLTYDEVVEALRNVGPLVTFGRCWLGACRVLMDCGFIHKGRYDKFCQLVKSILPFHAHLPKAAELQRMAVLSFAKPFAEWNENNAPVHGKYYAAYHEIGEAMLNELPK